MTFVDEGKKLRAQGRRNPKQAANGGASQEVQCHRPEFNSKDIPPLLCNSDLPVKEGPPVRMPSPRAEQDQIVSCFIAAMFPLGVTSMQISLFGTWLWHIPPRLGVNAALDCAAVAVALAFFARTTGDALALKSSEASYGAALQHLVIMLKTERTQFEPEVLCATMLLGHYESFTGTVHAWIRHAGGASRLMRLRGARRSYESAFEYSMFLTSRGAIISEALQSEQSCFLEQEAWQAIPDGLIQFPLLPKDAVLYHRIFSYYASIPGLLKQLNEVTANTPQGWITNLLSKGAALCENIKQWHADYTAFNGGYRTPIITKSVITATEDSTILEHIYTYYDTISASNITTCYAYRLLLQQRMDSLRPGTYLADNIQLAESICMSIDYLSNAGYCGASVLRFSLPVAQPILPAKHLAWVTSKITQLSQSLEGKDLIPKQSPQA